MDRGISAGHADALQFPEEPLTSDASSTFHSVDGGCYGEMMHEAFRGGANAWLAYDWVYPPSKGGQSLIHVDWGKDYL